MAPGEIDRRCEHVAACAQPAAWVIAVGADQMLLACDQHRNDVLARFEPKDVSGIFPLSALDEDGGE